MGTSVVDIDDGAGCDEVKAVGLVEPFPGFLVPFAQRRSCDEMESALEVVDAAAVGAERLAAGAQGLEYLPVDEYVVDLAAGLARLRRAGSFDLANVVLTGARSTLGDAS